MTPRISEQDEFLLSQLVDGDMPAEQAAALRERLVAEPVLRECFEAMYRVNEALKARRADQPTINIELFHDRLMQQVAESVSVSEQDEFLVGQFLDGELRSDERRSLEERLKAEPALRQCNDELERLNTAFAEMRLVRPAVDYAHFHEQLMDRIAAEERPVRAPIRFPIWMRIATPIAVAASIALVVLLQPVHTPVQPGPSGTGQPIVADIRKPVVPETPADEPLIVVVARNAASLDESRPMDIQVGRPGGSGLESTGIQVSYTRNTQLADAIRDADSELASRPARKVFFTAVSVTPPKGGGGEGDLF